MMVALLRANMVATWVVFPVAVLIEELLAKRTEERDMSENPSIWQKEIKLPWGDLRGRLLGDADQWASFICLSLFIVAPFVVGILSLFYLNMDKTVLAHSVIIMHIVWPLSVFIGVIAFGIALLRSRLRWKQLLSCLQSNPVFVCFGALVLWMLVSSCVNGCNNICRFGDSQHFRFETIYTQLGNILLLFTMGLLLRDKNKKRALARLHEIISLFLAIVAVILWKVGTVNYTVYLLGPNSVASIFSGTNYYGYYLAVSVPLAAAMFVAERLPSWKIFSALTLVANSSVLALNDTLGAWVACSAAMVFLLIARGVLTRRVDSQVLLMAALFGACLYLTGRLQGRFARNFNGLYTDFVNIITNSEDADNAGSGRWIIWKLGLGFIADEPVFGIGFDGVVARGLYERAIHARVHNEFLQYTMFYGIPAGVAYFAGCIGVYIRAVRRRMNLDPITLACLTGAFGYLVSSFFGLTLFSTVPYLFIFLGMGYVRR